MTSVEPSSWCHAPGLLPGRAPFFAHEIGAGPGAAGFPDPVEEAAWRAAAMRGPIFPAGVAAAERRVPARPGEGGRLVALKMRVEGCAAIGPSSRDPEWRSGGQRPSGTAASAAVSTRLDAAESGFTSGLRGRRRRGGPGLNLALHCSGGACFLDPPFSLSAARFQPRLENASWTASLGAKSQISRAVFFSSKTLADKSPFGSVRDFSIHLIRQSQVLICQPSTNS